MTAPAPAPGRLRVLWGIKGLGRGGAEQLLLSAARSTTADDVCYEVFYVLPWKQALVAELDSLGVPAHLIGSRRRAARTLWPWRLRRLLRANGYQVIHLHSPLVAAVARAVVLTLPRDLRPAVVYTEHNVWDSYVGVTRWANALTFRLNAHSFAVSPVVHRSISSRTAAPVETLVHGIVRADFVDPRRPPAATRASLGLSPEDVAIITVANIREHKGYPLLIDVADLVSRRHPNVRFFAVGDGPQRSAVESSLRQRGLTDVFTLLGTRSDIPDLLHAADAFVLASSREGFPIAVMEAMAAGKPGAFTRVGGIPDVVRHEVDALLVPPEDSAALAAAVSRLVEDPDLRKRFGGAARQRSEQFDVVRCVERSEEVYRDLCGRRAVL